MLRDKKIVEIISCFGATVLTLVCFYKFGRFLDIVYIKYALHPEHFNDPIVFSHFYTPYGYVDRFLSLIYSIIRNYVSIESFIMIIYGLLLFVSLLTIMKLMKEIFQDRIVALLTIFAFVFNVKIISLGAPLLVRYYFSPFSFTLPLQVLSLLYFYRQKYVIAFLLVALSFNIHVTTSIYLLMIYSILVLFNVKNLNYRLLLSILGVSVIGSAPTVVPVILSMKHMPGVEPWVAEFYRFATYGHISFYYLFKYNPYLVIISLPVLSALIIGNSNAGNDKRQKFIKQFIAASLIIYILQIIAVDVFRSLFFIRLELLSSTWFMMLLGLGFFINCAVCSIRSGTKDYIYIMPLLGGGYLSLLGSCGYIGRQTLNFRESWKNHLLKFNLLYIITLITAIMLGMFVGKFNIFHGLFAAAIGVSYYFQKRVQRLAYVGLTMFFIFMAINYYAFNKRISEDTLYKDICQKTMLLENKAKVIYPLNNYDYYLYGERGGFFAYYYPYITNYDTKLFAYACEVSKDLGVDLKTLIDNIQWDKIWYSAWVNLKEKQFQQLKTKYEVTHIIRENEHVLNFPVIARNSKYSLYEIK